jgi:hypothetical protein
MNGWREMGRFRATRAVVALVAAVACLGGVAYAASRSEQDRPRSKKGAHAGQKQGQRPPRPRFAKVPPAVAVGNGWRFRFRIANRAGTDQPRFQCQPDGSGWKPCSSPRRLGSLSPGSHAFAVRALNRRGLAGPAAHYRWSQVEPREFTIVPPAGSLEELMPGAPPQQLPVRIENPNPAPIEVTALTVSVTPEAAACGGDPNFAVTPSSLSPAAPLTVPAGGSAELPTATATAPTLALRELPVDQNACQGTAVHLDFSGEARG